MTFENFMQIASLVVSVLSVFGFGVIMKNFWNDKRQKKAEETSEAKEKLKKEKQDEIREVLQEEIAPVINNLHNVEDRIKKNNEGTVTLLRDRMKASLDKCECKGWASDTDKANWNELYKAYADLGGNHFREYVNQWKITMDNLPDENHKPKQSKKTN